MAKKKDEILEQEVVEEVVKEEGKKLINEFDIKCRVSELSVIDTKRLNVEIENKGIGDVFVSDKPVNIVSADNLLMVGQIKQFSGVEKVYLFSYSRPIVRIRLFQ